MAAGDLLTGPFQVELRAYLMGDGTSIHLDYDRAGDWLPFGEGATKTGDVELLHAAGSYGSPDYDGSLVFNFPFVISTGDAASAELLAADMRDVWTVASDVDIPLYQWMPGVGKFYVMGRPRRPYQEGRKNAEFGTITIFSTFVALDPTITYV